MTRSIRRLVRLLAVLAPLLAAHGGAKAQEAADPALPASDERIQQLIQTLEDPARREQLITSLQALLAAQGEPPAAFRAQPPAESPRRAAVETEAGSGARARPAPEVAPPAEPEPEAVAQPELPAAAQDAVGRLLSEISARTAIVRDVVETVVSDIQQIPDLVRWAEEQLRNPVARELWVAVGVRVTSVLGVGILAYQAVGLSTRRLRRRIVASEGEGLIDRISRMVVWLMIELLPVVVFVIAAYAVLAMAGTDELAPRVAVPLVMAVVIVRTSVAGARVLFAPNAPGLRVLPLDDAAAAFGLRWTRRLLNTGVYGYFLLEAARLVGMPWGMYGLVLHFLLLAIAIMVITLVVKIRQPVAGAIASLGEEGRSPALRRLPWRTLASLWHVLVLLYVLSIYLVWALQIPGGFRMLLEATVGTVLVAVAGWLAWRGVALAVDRPERPSADEEHGSEALMPGFGRRADRYLPLLGTLARGVVILGVGLGLLQVWGFGTLTWLFSEDGSDVIGHVVTVSVIILITVGVWELISLMIERHLSETDEEGNLKASNRTRTLLTIMRNALLIFLSLVALFLVLSELGLNIAPLLAGAGVIGIAIGFGSQKLVQDIITGLFILLGDTVRVGDVIEVGGRAGIVEQTTMRTIALRDLAGNVHTIPYSSIDTVMNYTKDFSYALLDIAVSYRENVDEVIQVLRDLGTELNRDPAHRRNILEPLEILGVDALSDSGVIIKVRFKTRPLFQWMIGREFRRRVKNRFDELGIEIPYPHRTLYFGTDRQGRAAAARVDLQQPQAPAGTPEVDEPLPEAALLAQPRGG